MSDKAQLLQEYMDGQSANPRVTYQVLAQRHGISKNAVAGRIRDARAERVTKIVHVNRNQWQVDPLPTLAELNDRERWRSDLRDLLESEPYLIVAKRPDRHNPFGDEDAATAWDVANRILQPHIVIRGDDEDDNPQISFWVRSGQQDAPPMEIDDFLDAMRMQRFEETNRVKSVVPAALQVNLEGNHGWKRFLRWHNEAGRQPVQTSDMRRYIENVRSRNDVYWIGPTESVVFPGLIAMHGKRWGKNAAEQTLKDRNFAKSIMASHAHKPGTYSTMTPDRATNEPYPVNCVISGCLCDLRPHYRNEEDDDYSPWQHGFSYAVIDTRYAVADLKEIRFNHSANHLWFEMGGQIYTLEKQAADSYKKKGNAA